MNNDLYGETEYARVMINRIVNFSIDCILENKPQMFDNLNVAEYKQTLYYFIEPIVIFYVSKTENYTISSDKIVFLSNNESFKPACYELNNKNYLSNIYDVSLYVLRKVLWFFNLVSSENNDIINVSEKEYINKTINSFITLISILLEIYFSNNGQMPDIKELLELIKNKLNILDIKDIMPNINSNVEFKLLTCIINRFELDKREIETAQLTNLNLKNIPFKDKNTNKTIVDEKQLRIIKDTLATFIATLTTTITMIKAVVHIISLIVEKIPALSSLVNKNFGIINNIINGISSVGTNLFNNNTTKQIETNPRSKYTAAGNGKETIKDFNSKSKDGNGNNSIGNGLLGNNNSNSGKGIATNGDGSINTTPNGRIGNPDNPLVPSQNNNKQNSNSKFNNDKITDLEPKPNVSNNFGIIDGNEKAKDIATIDNIENNVIQKNGEINNDDNIFNNIDLDDGFSGFSEKDNIDCLDCNQKDLKEKLQVQPLSQDTPSNLPENNPTSTQPSDNTNDTSNNIENNTNKTSEPCKTSFQDKIKKENSNTKSIIEEEKKKHGDSKNKSHAEIIETKKKGDDFPDNSLTLY